MKTALITGATDGIGKATALKLLKEGWHVVIGGRSAAKCETIIHELKQKSGNDKVSAFVADLSKLSEVKLATNKFIESHNQLDLLLLNANSIANDRILTTEGNEQNFAMGYLSRVLMIQKLEKILENTPNSQILSVMGRSWKRIDFEDITLAKNFTGWNALTGWQWAFALYLKNYSDNEQITSNIYSPGLVKTKILANEPQPMRFLVKLMNIIMGISTEECADNLYFVIDDLIKNRRTGHFFEWKKDKGLPAIKYAQGDIKKLISLTDKIVMQYI